MRPFTLVGTIQSIGNPGRERHVAERVRGYAGIHPVTGKRHMLREVVEPGPTAWKEAECIHDRLRVEVVERRDPRYSTAKSTSSTAPRTRSPSTAATCATTSRPTSGRSGLGTWSRKAW